MQIAAAKGAAETGWDKFKQLSAGCETKGRAKPDVIREAQNKRTSVHFATLKVCHLKHSELAEHVQNYEG